MPVTTEQRDQVLLIRLDRPAKRNAIDREMALGIDAALNRLDDDPELWVGVLTGTATVFSAGTDIAAAEDVSTERGGEYGIIRRRRSTPLIAAVEGLALGGGLEIALACDLVVAAADARFGLPETRRGLVATSGALFRAARALPPAIARELLITGRYLDAQRAHTLGLVNEVTTPGQAVDGALAMAADICSSSPVSVRETLRALDTLVTDQDEAGWAATRSAIEVIMASADMREGINAFLERRPPRWQGR